MVEQLLGPAHREGGDEDRAAPGDRLRERPGQLVGNRVRAVGAVAVGRLDQDVVRLADGVGIGQDRGVPAAQVSREDDDAALAPLADLEADRGGADDVAGTPEGRPVGRGRRHRRVVAGTRDPQRGRQAVLGRVQRQRRGVPGGPARVVVGGLFLLQVPGVREQDAGQVGGGPRRVYRPREAVGAQARQVADVVDVAVGEDDGVDGARRDRQRRPVPLAQRREPLVEAAVDQQPAAGGLDQELGPGDRPRRPETVDGRDHARDPTTAAAPVPAVGRSAAGLDAGRARMR